MSVRPLILGTLVTASSTFIQLQIAKESGFDKSLLVPASVIAVSAFLFVKIGRAAKDIRGTLITILIENAFLISIFLLAVFEASR